ncbi:peptidoglycan D,D-transpeptidase FtsI family protein [Bacillus sp. SCS-151]|uniref:peptidoglycan D,D-transpeptidase FtsI family protein n=1 Tax=Nanhaiella sioensis TaxID=3115293 RepID=UPI00397DA826
MKKKQKNNKKKRNHLPFRLNVLFFIVFLLFSILILKLGLTQIVYGEDYRREIEKKEEVTVSASVPRGKIYDRNGKVIVDNLPLNAITYTGYQGTTAEERLKVARDLAIFIDKDTKDVTERDKKDFWMLTHPEEALEKVTDAELKKLDDGGLEATDIYKLQLNRITEEELAIITGQELEVLAIYREFSGYALTPQIVKSNSENKNDEVSEEEYAVVSEHLSQLPGVDTTTDWVREYPYGDTFRTVLGNITSSKEGLPSEVATYYVAKEYSRNDRVGKSYIEKQYEDVLHGQKEKVKNITDKAGNPLNQEVITEGANGKDLVLSIDMDLQIAIEKIIEEELVTAKSKSGSAFLDRAFVVMMNPTTGEVLSLAGKQYVKNDQGEVEFLDFARGTFQLSYAMGSTVKGATVLTGFETNTIKPGTTFIDSPLNINGLPKGSYKVLGPVNDLDALKKSSNVYMFHTAIGVGEGNYAYGKPLYINTAAFDTFRYYFSQFGLGVKTGIDLPGEQTGFAGTDTLPGLLLDLSIGQYDTYTPLQLAQYVSTIANGGYRVKPQIVKDIHQPSDGQNGLGPILKEFKPEILNRVDMKKEYIEQVQEGFRQVMQESGGTAVGSFGDKPYKPAGKTGTAQVDVDKSENVAYAHNLTLIGYAPYDNPEVAFSVVAPTADYGNSKTSINLNIGERILDEYFNLKQNRANGTEQEVIDEAESELTDPTSEEENE